MLVFLHPPDYPQILPSTKKQDSCIVPAVRPNIPFRRLVSSQDRKGDNSGRQIYKKILFKTNDKDKGR